MLDYIIVLSLRIWVNEVNSKTGIPELQVVIGMTGCYLFQAGFIDLIVHCQKVMQMRPYKGSVKLAKDQKLEHIYEKWPHWEKGCVSPVQAIHTEPSSLPYPYRGFRVSHSAIFAQRKGKILGASLQNALTTDRKSKKAACKLSC